MRNIVCDNCRKEVPSDFKEGSVLVTIDGEQYKPDLCQTHLDALKKAFMPHVVKPRAKRTMPKTVITPLKEPVPQPRLDT